MADDAMISSHLWVLF